MYLCETKGDRRYHLNVVNVVKCKYCMKTTESEETETEHELSRRSGVCGMSFELSVDGSSVCLNIWQSKQTLCYCSLINKEKISCIDFTLWSRTVAGKSKL